MPIVRRNEPISSWQEGDFVQGFALLGKKEMRQDRNGRDYLDLELCDSSGRVSAKVWSDSPALKGDYEAKNFVAFKGVARSYRDQLQINIDHCRRVCDDDKEHGFDESALIPSTKEDIDDLWQRLTALVPGLIERPLLRRLSEVAIERYGERLKYHPAAKTIHHAYRGGLLEHVVSMAELARLVVDHYGDVDRDLVLIGVLFHDLGKLRELGAMPANDYTLEGHLVGHVVIGRDMLLECCAALDDFPEELRLHLEHLVLSHQGRREYGTPIEPMTLEAFILHFIDDLDSKLNQLRQARESGEAMQYIRGLGRYTYLKPPPTADVESSDDSGND